MPLQYKVHTEDMNIKEKMLQRLFEEWRDPHTDRPEPVIIEESPGNGARTNHIYVVWTEWESLGLLERSKIIMQAYEKYRGHDLASDVTVAMGLTPAEADKLHIEYMAA